VVRANLLAADAQAASGRRFNVGTGRQVTINNLWQVVAAQAGVSRSPNHLAARAGDIRESVADIALAGKVLGFAPEFTFEQGLKATYQWYQGQKAEV